MSPCSRSAATSVQAISVSWVHSHRPAGVHHRRQAILDTILRDIPGAVVIDSQWESVNTPPVRDRIADAGWNIGIWNRAARSMLSGRVRTNGRVETPYSDYIIAWQRSLTAAGVLEHGRWFTSLTVSDV